MWEDKTITGTVAEKVSQAFEGSQTSLFEMKNCGEFKNWSRFVLFELTVRPSLVNTVNRFIAASFRI